MPCAPQHVIFSDLTALVKCDEENGYLKNRMKFNILQNFVIIFHFTHCASGLLCTSKHLI